MVQAAGDRVQSAHVHVYLARLSSGHEQIEGADASVVCKVISSLGDYATHIERADASFG